MRLPFSVRLYNARGWEYELIKSFVLGCRRGGHVICSPCRRKVIKCGLCGDAMLDCRSMATDHLLNVTLKDWLVKCPFKDCTEYKQLKVMFEHPEKCGHQEATCPGFKYFGCKWCGTLATFSQHAQECPHLAVSSLSLSLSYYSGGVCDNDSFLLSRDAKPVHLGTTSSYSPEP